MNALTDEQLECFARDGYLVVPDVVNESLLRRVDVEVDGLLAADPPPPNEWNKHQYAPPPERMPACVDVLGSSGALALAEQLVAPHGLENAINHVQVAVNYPNFRHVPGGPHLDCHDGTGDPYSFTVLVGLYLGDESRPGLGNLYVWPGSHREHARLFNERGVHVLQSAFGHATLLDPPLALGAPEPVLAKRGDVVLSHFLTGHNTSGNETDQMRRIVYFRLSAKGHRDRWRETFLDPWTEYAPLRRFDLGEEAEVIGREGTR